MKKLIHLFTSSWDILDIFMNTHRHRQVDASPQLMSVSNYNNKQNYICVFLNKVYDVSSKLICVYSLPNLLYW